MDNPNPNDPADPSPEDLTLFSRSHDLLQRRLAARHRNTPPAALAHLSQDPNHLTRLEVVCNPNTPTETLLQLSSDAHQSVRISAIFRLADRQLAAGHPVEHSLCLTLTRAKS